MEWGHVAVAGKRLSAGQSFTCSPNTHTLALSSGVAMKGGMSREFLDRFETIILGVDEGGSSGAVDTGSFEW